MSLNAKAKLTLAAVATVSFVAGAVLAGIIDLTPAGNATTGDSADLDALRRIGKGFSGVVKEVSPSVVNVRVSKKVHAAPGFGGMPVSYTHLTLPTIYSV